jgi:protein-S-isoprenylcysteine O-methyltransferase Ste14
MRQVAALKRDRVFGHYGYIRHPIYASGFYGAYGVFFKNPSWPGIALALSATVFFVLTAKVEEKECIRFFGADYQAYMRETNLERVVA